MLQGLWARRRPSVGDTLRRAYKPVVERLEVRRMLADVTIDFDFDGLGNPTTSGQIMDNEYANLGLTLSTNDPGSHPLMIFDSSNPTGGDTDLGTANETFGGPGIGIGGESGQPGENSVPVGNLLIISEDGSQVNPDDNLNGGTITFSFANPAHVVSLDIVDIEEVGVVVECFDSSNVLLATVPVLTLGNNSYQTVTIEQAGVSKMQVIGPGSMGVPHIVLREPDPPHPEGRMTGGGSIFLPAGAIGGAAGTRVTHGFELHCAEPSELINNRLQVNWNNGNSANRFHLLTLLDVECEDTPLIQAPPDAPIDTMYGLLGAGRFSGKHNGITYDKVAAEITFTFTDAGEPGVNDTAIYHVVVLDGNKDGTANDPVVVLDSNGAHPLIRGNHQAHNELANLTTLATQVRTEYNATLSKFDDPRVTQTKLNSYVDTVLSQFIQFETVNDPSYVPPPTTTKGGGGGGKGKTSTTSATSYSSLEQQQQDALTNVTS